MRAIEVFASAALLGACVSYHKPIPQLPEPPARPPLAFPGSAKQSRLTAIVLDLPMGHRFGETAWGDGGCSTKNEVVNTQGRFEFDLNAYSDVFNAALRQRGYPVDDGLELFKNSKERVADLLVAARVIDATVNQCFPRISQHKLRDTGSAYLKVEWSVFSNLEKRVVLVVTTEGSTRGTIESTIGEPGLLRVALQDAAIRLAADASFYRLVASQPPAAEVASRIRLKRLQELSGELKANLETVRKAVATITANRGYGSGFVISDDGKVLTAEHVISGSKYVKVGLGGKKECYGEVIASSKQRDLAVIQTDCRSLTPLPLGSRRLLEGAEVFAVGTPVSSELQFSVTKGVVSGVRKFEDLDYIQSDVSVLPGSSGGPLLDPSGNAIGVTSAGVASGSVPVGVNFFVPLAGIERYLPLAFE